MVETYVSTVELLQITQEPLLIIYGLRFCSEVYLFKHLVPIWGLKFLKLCHYAWCFDFASFFLPDRNAHRCTDEFMKNVFIFYLLIGSRYQVFLLYLVSEMPSYLSHHLCLNASLSNPLKKNACIWLSWNINC